MEVGHVDSSATCESFAVNLLANDVEQLDTGLFIIARINCEMVGSGVRIDSEVLLLHFRNIHDFAF